MAVTRAKTWIDTEILSHTDLNAEFDNILDNGEDVGWPATKTRSMAGFKLDLDSDGDTSITADTDDQIDIEIAGADDFQFTANRFTVLSGSNITAASGTTGMTDGFLFIPAAAGAPSGAVTIDTTTLAAVYYDTTNEALYVYNHVSNAWVSVTLS